jgi:Glycine zipper 2TM domain
MKTLLIATALVCTSAIAVPALARDHDGSRPGYAQNGRGPYGYHQNGYRGDYRGQGNRDYRGGYYTPQPVRYGGYAPPAYGYAPRGYAYAPPIRYRGYNPYYTRPVVVAPRYYGAPVGYYGAPVGYYGAPVYAPPVVAQVGYYGGPGYAAPVGYYGNQGYDPCRSSGTGAVIGAIAGGLIGNSVAGYGDRGLGTVIGAGLGAVTGTAIERNSRCGY